MKNTELNHRKWLDDLGLSHPLVIAGPCSAETEEQVLQTAHALKDSDVSYLRAGIWKPRTRPGNFEGVGAIGLPWLQRAKAETGLGLAIEVANKHHVAHALKADVDIMWIGARTTVNPFVVQEIADALNGTDKIVLVKNPINADLSLWKGAIERLQLANIKNIGAIHRGFSTYKKIRYRNIPEWQIPIDFKAAFPNIPLINDPSHIAGNRDWIYEVSQKALDLNFDGFIIESHVRPDEAWSDAKQQVTPKHLFEIIDELKIRKLTDDHTVFKEKLTKYRSEIDIIDNQIMEALGHRMKIARKIGTIKKERNVAILQSKRWQEVLDKIILASSENGLSENFINKFYKAVHQESISQQEQVIFRSK